MMRVLLLGSLALAFLLPLSAAETPLEPTPIAVVTHPAPVQFMTEVLPIFKKNCLACHNASTAKGDLVLETPASILKGGESGPAAAPGKGAESLLIKAASRQTKPFMPPRNNKVEANPLTSEELGLVKLWIDQGATGVVSVALGPVKWQPLPPGLNPINAVALSADGQFAACGRANQIFLYHVPSGELVTRLTDPDLVKEEGAAGVADRDFIESLAFSPDGQTLASGSYRVVKLWKREEIKPKFTLTPTAAIRAIAISPDGKWFATALENHSIELWDAKGRTIVRTLTGATGTVRVLRFSENSTLLAAGGADKRLRLWKVQGGELGQTIESPGEVQAAAWLNNGKQLAYGGTDGHIHLHDFEKGAELKTLAGHVKGVSALEPLGQGRLLSAGADGFIREWNISDGAEKPKIEHGKPILALAVRKDGKRFASSGADNAVKLWNAESGKLVVELKGERHKLEKAAEAERLVTFSKGEVSFHKTALENSQKQEKTEQEAEKKAAEAKAAAEKTAAEKLAVSKAAEESKSSADKALASFSQAVKLASQNKDLADKLGVLLQNESKTISERLASAKALAEKAAKAKAAAYDLVLQSSAAAHAARDKAAAAKGSADKGEKPGMNPETAQEQAKVQAALAEAQVDAATRAKNALDDAEQTRQALEELTKQIPPRLASAADSAKAADKLVADAKTQEKDADGKVKAAEKILADAAKALKQAETVKTNAIEAYESALASLKRASQAVAAANKAMDAAQAALKDSEKARDDATRIAKESETTVRTLAFSPDGRTLATGGDDRLIHTWNAETGKAYDAFSAHGSNIVSLAYAPDGTLLSAAGDPNLRQWASGQNWKLERKIGNGENSDVLIDRVLALDFTADGEWLATGGGVPSRSGEIKIWNAANGQLVKELKDPHSDTVFTLDFSSDRKLLASGGADKFVKVFDTSSGKLVKSFEGHTHHVLGVSWKRDGRTLASSGADKVIKVWDFTNGEQRKTIEGFNKEITSIHFIDGGNEALVSSGDNQVKLIREDGNNVRSFSGSGDFVQSAAITPDGKLVAAGGYDSVLRIWNGANGEIIKAFEPPMTH